MVSGLKYDEINMRAHIYTHSHVHNHIYTQKCAHTQIQVSFQHTFRIKNAEIGMQTHTHTHTHTHTKPHIYTKTKKKKQNSQKCTHKYSVYRMLSVLNYADINIQTHINSTLPTHKYTHTNTDPTKFPLHVVFLQVPLHNYFINKRFVKSDVKLNTLFH